MSTNHPSIYAFNIARALMDAPEQVSENLKDAITFIDVMLKMHGPTHVTLRDIRDTASKAVYYETSYEGLALSDEQLDAFRAINEHCAEHGVPLPPLQ